MIQRLKSVAVPLIYCLLASTTLRLFVAVACLAVSLLLTVPQATRAQGEFTVANCQADQTNYSVRAFTHFAHRGMLIRYACRPSGPGLRGVVTQNVVRKARVKRGSVAEVSIAAPPGTRMTSFAWAGEIRRRDCRYALQMWADGPGKPIPLKNVKANHGCPRPRRAQAAQFKENTYSIPGATRITQRVVCVGTKKQKWCSAREPNYIKTERASVVFADAQPPSVAIQQDTPLAQGAWVSGPQTINYTASDNVGVQQARALLNGQEAALHIRDCLLVAPTGPFTGLQPCPNGLGQLVIRTGERLAEGTQLLVVEAQDPAANRTASAPITARVDTTAPPRVDVGVEGGTAWRADNNWVATWTNPHEGDRAPITGATYQLCAVGGTSCSRGSHAGEGIARLPLTVPSSGEWTLSLWLRDAAGNEDKEHASVPIPLRYDPEPPELGFESFAADDPTLVAVRASDRLSGVAGGSIEIAASGSSVWQTLSTQVDGSHLVTRIDDAALPAGAYLLRARARDRAGNEAILDRRGDGQPVVIALPLRKSASLDAGFELSVRRRDDRRGRVVVVRPTARVELGEQIRITGRLATSDGQAIAGATVQLLTTTVAGAEQTLGTVKTAGDGWFRTVVTGAHTRAIRLVFAGSQQALPGQKVLTMRVPAATSARVNRHRVRNGQAVRFSGRVQGLPVPAAGKLVEIQVRFTDRWQTFRTTRSDGLGRWSSRYRFQRTSGVQRYRFRIRLPKEAGYPFETSVSHGLGVQVSGR